MDIKLEHISRRFNKDWIFREIDYFFEEGQSYAILGPNGSGKSTLLQVIAGSLTPSEGKISYIKDGNTLDADLIFKELSIAAPYIELIEEFTLSELLDFHFRFKRYHNLMDKEAVIALLGFERSKDKEIRHFSSGMKQRTKLALSFCSDTPVLLLDEPTSNLDSNGISWYMNLVSAYTSGRTVIVGSNQEYEYSFCRRHIRVTDYKNP